MPSYKVTLSVTYKMGNVGSKEDAMKIARQKLLNGIEANKKHFSSQLGFVTDDFDVKIENVEDFT